MSTTEDPDAEDEHQVSIVALKATIAASYAKKAAVAAEIAALEAELAKRVMAAARLERTAGRIIRQEIRSRPTGVDVEVQVEINISGEGEVRGKRRVDDSEGAATTPVPSPASSAVPVTATSFSRTSAASKTANDSEDTDKPGDEGEFDLDVDEDIEGLRWCRWGLNRLKTPTTRKHHRPPIFIEDTSDPKHESIAYSNPRYHNSGNNSFEHHSNRCKTRSETRARAGIQTMSTIPLASTASASASPTLPRYICRSVVKPYLPTTRIKFRALPDSTSDGLRLRAEFGSTSDSASASGSALCAVPNVSYGKSCTPMAAATTTKRQTYPPRSVGASPPRPAPARLFLAPKTRRAP
ncbi:hypothetical protein EIP86_011070 [Pleurotus ostreatoroseus]|nr:hypothetical protein EIP86_008893 [Pleurotus ostreatoroseus]KAF7799828.1 hypothetical protein EIP86_011070 [Pleurotus ostreatoroseus]